MNMRPPEVAPEAAAAPAPVMSERRVALLGALLVAVGPFSMSLYTPAMPEIVQYFGTTDAAVRLSLSLFFAGFAVAQLVCGPLSDGLGRRPVTIAFMLIYAAASIMAVFAETIETLIAARFLQGIGAAVGVAMSRAIVRDLFANEQSARILNIIGMILGIAPATAPIIGGLTMEFFGWHAIFIVMAGAGLTIVTMAILVMKETVQRDISRIQPRALIATYRQLLGNKHFITASITNATTSGVLYSVATVMPFILIQQVGLTAGTFGLVMLIQSGSYLAGSVALRFLMPHFGAFRLVPVGLGLTGLASLLMLILLRLYEPSVLLVMGPMGVFTFGLAMITPAASTAAMQPFGRNAGAASALLGFMQMGTGLVGGVIMTLMGDPVHAMATVIPCLGACAVVSWMFWLRLDRKSPNPLSQRR